MNSNDLYKAIDEFVDDLNWKYLDMQFDTDHDLFGIEDWNHWRRLMRMTYFSEGLNTKNWILLLKKLLHIRDEDLSPVILGDRDLDELFYKAERLLEKLRKEETG